jgi:large subunit ribosomal protein L28
MARTCQVTGKKTTSGNNRPFSLKATKRTFRPNLFWKKMWNPETGKVERMKLSAKAIKTLKKLAEKAGFKMVSEKAAEKAKLAGQNIKHTTNEEKGRVHKQKLTPKQKKELAAAEEAAKMEKAATFETKKKED